MRIVRIALCATLAACSGSAAWAQYGLYGSPDNLRLPSPDSTPVATAPANSPYAATPTPATPPTPAYAVQPGYRYAAPPASPEYQPQPSPQVPPYRYPAQAGAATTYQPYQAGAQYRYPGPAANRPPVRTASVDPAMQGQPALGPLNGSGYVSAGALQAAPAGATTPQSGGMMNQVLADQPCNGYAGADGSGVYRGAVNQFEQSACGASGGCGLDACGAACYCPWYVSVEALVMSRGDGRRFWTSYDDSDETIQLSNSQVPLAWKWGGELRFGRRFCCTGVPYAIEATYWTTDALTGSQTTAVPGGLVSTPLNLNYLNFGANPATDWFFGAQSQTVTRLDEFHNVELNLIREQLAWACNSPWDIGWSVGVRYFRFQERLTFATLAFDGVSDAYFSDQITNDLIGAQFGFDAAYNIGCGLRVFITPKVGIYDNFITSDFVAEGKVGAGPYVVGTGPYGSYPVHGTATVLSFLTQIDVGVDWQITRNWSARAGYRVVAVTGMGLADDQYPQYMCDTPEIANVQNPSSLVLHGAFLGATYNF